jgi:predicted nuclease of predicted toxin-antitoxin system
MRLLSDQDVYALTISHLRGLGHDVVTASELGLATASDLDILKAAIAEHRVLLTRDRDFGNLVFVKSMRCGVIYMRMLPSTVGAVHDELDRVLATYNEDDLLCSLIVIEPGRHRVRPVG